MGVHKHWHALWAHFFTPAEFHGTGSTGEDEPPCGTIESVKMANGRNDLVELMTVYQMSESCILTRVCWIPGWWREGTACSPPPFSDPSATQTIAGLEWRSGYFWLLPTVGLLYFSVTLAPASSVSTFTAEENSRHKPDYKSCFSEDRSGWNVEDSLGLILHQRINQFKYKSIDKLFTSFFFFLSHFRKAHRRKGENHFRLNN